MKRPKWMQKITPRMLIIWAVAFVGFVIVGLGTTCITLALIPVTHSSAIDYDKVFSIQYMNETKSKQLFKNNSGSNAHEKAMSDILKQLEKGGKTNLLTNLFSGSPSQSVENNKTNITYTSTFTSTYSNNAIIISYYPKNTQYNVESNDSNESFTLTTEKTATSDAIHRILIPLNNTSNRLQEQTWYLLTYDPTTFPSGQSLLISKTIKTYGNYHALNEYVQGLNVRV